MTCECATLKQNTGNLTKKLLTMSWGGDRGSKDQPRSGNEVEVGGWELRKA